MGKKNKLKKVLNPSPSDANDADDDELVDDLIAQLESRDQTVQAESATVLQEVSAQRAASSRQDSTSSSSKARFLARQARKAANLAAHFSHSDPEADARLEKEAKDEEKAIDTVCEQLGVEMFEVNPDGHCLFSAIADQLLLYSILSRDNANYATVRLAASSYMFSHPDDFLPFLPSEESGLMSPKEFEDYCVSIRDTAVWGGEPEIQALTRAYNIPVHVIQGGNPPIVVHNPAGGSTDDDIYSKRALRISYHRRMYGLGEHYNSLRPKRKTLLG